MPGSTLLSWKVIPLLPEAEVRATGKEDAQGQEDLLSYKLAHRNENGIMRSYLQTVQRAQQLVLQSRTIPSAHFGGTDETFSTTPEQRELRGTKPGILLDKMSKR